MVFTDVEEFKNKAIENKKGLRKKWLTIPVGDEDQDFRLSGIGAKAIKIEKFVKYDDIMEAIEAGRTDGLEAMLMEIVEEYEPEEEEEIEE